MTKDSKVRFNLDDYVMQRDPGETDADFAARLALFEHVRDAIGSAATEGLETTPETRALLQRYVAGELGIEDVLAAILKTLPSRKT